MKSLFIFGLVILAIILVLIVICRIFFRNSIVSSLVLFITNMSCASAFMSYVVAMEGFSSLVWVLPVIALFALLNFQLLNRYYRKPILNINNKIVTQLANGDFNHRIDESLINRKDEYGLIALGIETMRSKIADIITDIYEIVRKIEISAEQQGQTAVYISSGASEQAASSEEISSTIEELTASNHQNAENAKSTAMLSESVYTAMEELSRASKQNLESLTDIINRISVVNDISFQTNILALNASVEAARAGDAGRGFSVIAHEVRSLADVTKSAANDIKSLSGETLRQTENTVRDIDVYLEALKQTSDLLGQISSATAEQSLGADQINTAVQQQNQIAQQNSATSEELAASYEELSEQTKRLNTLLQFFKMN